MRRIRGRDTAPELLLRREVWSRGARYRLHARTPGGRPDMVFAREALAVFVDGCFWHGCPEHYVRPRTRRAFWGAKLRENVDRDAAQVQRLDAAGWIVLRLWEHEVAVDPFACAQRVMDALRSRRSEQLFWRVRVAKPHRGEIERWTLVELRSRAPDQVVLRKRSTRKWERKPS